VTRAVASLLRRYFDLIYFDSVRKRLAAQVELLQVYRPRLYLDLGCYTGEKTAQIHETIASQCSIGLEFDEPSLLEAQARGVNAIRHDLNLPLPLASASVSVITAFDVLEHLVEVWQLVSEAYRVLTPGGILLLDSPNLAAWHNVFALVLGFQPFSGPNLTTVADSDLGMVQAMHRRDHGLEDDSPDVPIESKMHRHIVVPAYRSLCRLLQRTGFRIVGSWGFGYYPFPPGISDLLCRVDITHAHHYIIKAQKPDTGRVPLTRERPARSASM
jgi:SAM-dependent methyltransferase